MRKTVTDRLVERLNKARGLSYPDIGYMVFADVIGGGSKGGRKLYTIFNEQGGLVCSSHNATPAKRVAALRILVEQAEKVAGLVRTETESEEA